MEEQAEGTSMGKGAEVGQCGVRQNSQMPVTDILS